MDLKWSYYLIGILYIILLSLKILNNSEYKKFQKNYGDTQQYKAYKSDFFTLIGWICTLITLIINIMTFVSKGQFVVSSIIVTILILGMAFMARSIKLLTTSEGFLYIDGNIIDGQKIKEVVIKQKNSRVFYHILYHEPINGYDSISFKMKIENQEAFESFVKNI